MIHCILGHGACGKSTIQNYLKNEIPTITTYTTRPIRHNEIDGIHYHFLSNYEFEERKRNGFFIEYYYIPENDWYYGMSLDGIDYKNSHYSLVLDPQGFKTLLEKIGKEYLMCYYIKLSEHERVMRMAQRKDKIEEIFRRILSDRKDFEGFHKFADVILLSKNSKRNANVILNVIKERAF
jgi:guanylate kinase